MRHVKQILILVFFIHSILHITFINAAELGSFGARIFNFQKKLAEKGNTLAQYKLGTMYEMGISVKPDLEKAKTWYLKAAKKDNKPAINRLTFLDIKKNSYDQSKHQSWLNNVVNDVKLAEPNALILYGQMNRYGIAVNKNLNNAISLMHKASSLGHTEIDQEIEDIKQEIASSREKKQAEQAEQAALDKKLRKKQAKLKQKKLNKYNAQKKKAEKRRKYERAMQKQREQERLIQQQQKWAESE